MRMLSKLTLMLPALLSFLLITAWAGFAQSTGGWKDNFDSGMLGTFPNGWMNSGNSAVSVSNAFYVSPGNSVQMYGIVRGCWAALAHREVVLSPPFTVQISVRNGDEALSGCHPVRATLGLNVGPSWTTPGIGLFAFDQSGNLSIGSRSLASLPLLQWNTVSVGYEFIDANTVRTTYRINGQPGIVVTRPAVAQEASMTWLTIQAGEGTAWFDDVKVTPGVSTAVTRVLPQLAFGGGWYTALYFTNTTTAPVSFPVSFIANDGNPLTVPALGASSVTMNLTARGAGVIELPNIGPLIQGYVTAALPTGLTGYGVFRQSVPGVPDQEAVVPLSANTSSTSTLLFDDTKYVTGVAVVNLAAVTNTITATARDNQGNSLGSGAITLAPNAKTALVLRNIPGLASLAGVMGSVDFTATIGSVAALGLRFNGTAFTSIATSDR